jgi:drug/metabolite transporter (DMT)-like permease
MLKRFRAELALTAGALTFGFNGVVAKLVLEGGMSAWRLTEIRCTGAFLAMLIYVLLTSPRTLKATKKELPLLIAFGVFGIAAVQAFYFISISKLHVSIALIIEFTSPIWISLWLRFVRKKHVSPLMWWGLTIGTLGLVLLAQVWKGLTLNGVGLFFALLDAFAMTCYFLFGEKLGKIRSSQVMMVWGLGVSAACFALAFPWWNFPFSFMSKQLDLHGRFAGHHLPGWALILWVVVMGTIVPYFFVLTGLRDLNASTSSVIGMLEPIFAGIFAWWWLNESFNAIQLVGAAVVLVGIYLADKSRSSASE